MGKTNPHEHGAPPRYDEAENIRKFTAQIRRASGQPAFPSGPEATSGAAFASASGNENHTDDEYRHRFFDEGGRIPLQPRALQQVMDESPQLKGIRAPHPTPESHRPSPSVGAEDPSEFSNDEIHLAMTKALMAWPTSGGLEASIWANKEGPLRKSIAPNVEKKSIAPGTKQGEKVNAEEARKRSQEHNENFERMSFKIAEAPSHGKTFASKPIAKSDNNGYTAEKPRVTKQPSYKEALGEGFSSGIIKTLTSPLSDRNTLSSEHLPSSASESNGAKEDRHYSVGTQTETDEYVFVSEPKLSTDSRQEHRDARKSWVKVSWASSMLPPDFVIEEAIHAHFQRAKLAHERALELLKSTVSKEEVVERLVNMGILKEQAVTVNGVAFVAYLPSTVKQPAEKDSLADKSVTAVKEVPKGNVSAQASPANTHVVAVKETQKGNVLAGASLEPGKDIGTKTKPVKGGVSSSDVVAAGLEAVKEMPKEKVSTPATSGSEKQVGTKTTTVKGGVSPSDVVAAGLKFAKSYNSRSWGSKTITLPKGVAELPATPFSAAKADSMTDKTVTPNLQVKTSAMDDGKETSGRTSGQSSSTITPSSMVFTLASPASVAEHGIAGPKSLPGRGENREKEVYFKAWGKPEVRLETAAQIRKVIIYGNPVWPSKSTKALFITKLVYGGPLEEIRCLPYSAEVTFLNAADAKKYHEATANGILYRQDATGKHYAEVRMAEDVTPTSSLVQHYVEKGATRCVSAIGFPRGIPNNDMMLLAGGKVTAQGKSAREFECVEHGFSDQGVRRKTSLPQSENLALLLTGS
ncbi:MAG: hypothetical protein Q9191_001372 [Dirinaria sp. TL-2023a]